MITDYMKYYRAIYKLVEDKSNDRISYYVKTTYTDLNLLTDIVKIEKDNGFHNTSRYFEHYLYLRTDTNWVRCAKTGLLFTSIPNVFHGNISRIVKLKAKTAKGKDFETPQHWVLVNFLYNKRRLVIDIFENFYPVQNDLKNRIIKEHHFHKI